MPMTHTPDIPDFEHAHNVKENLWTIIIIIIVILAHKIA